MSSATVELNKNVKHAASQFIFNYDVHYSSVTVILNSMKWPLLETRCKAAGLTKLYKISIGQLYISANKKHIIQSRRHSGKFKYIHINPKTETCNYSFFP